MERVFIGMGSNLGERQAYLDLGRRELATLPRTAFRGMSRPVETEPVGPVKQGKFLNAVALVETDLSPRELLDELRRIEMLAGRPPQESRVHWGPRTLDLDILLYGKRVIDEPGLTVPHPRLHERRFVLAPLVELDPEVRHPVVDLTAREMLQRLPT